MRRGEVYEWLPPGTESCLGDVRPVRMEVTRVARDGSWADIRCTDAGGGQWTKRHPAAPGCVPDGWRLLSPVTK